MKDISILIGGKAGDGVDRAGMVIAFLLNRLGYRLYVYREYPSLIRGGHTYSIIRASEDKINAHSSQIDVLLAMNPETLAVHSKSLRPDAAAVINASASAGGYPDLPKGARAFNIDMAAVIKEESAPPVTANSCMIGALARVLDIEWDVLDAVFREKMPKAIEQNLAVARRGYDAAETVRALEPVDQSREPVLTGNEALGLGLIKGGLSTYIAYPMTPTSTILHFMAGVADKFGLKVVHPESEIGVMLMALGASYAGEKAAVGTSGGGFCLMTEGFSFAGMAELPVVVVLGQRPGPSTGLPTYSSQTELHFALNAGQGEFARFLAAPGDAEESYYWAQIALKMAVKHRTPAIILTDKNLGESAMSFNADYFPEVPSEKMKARPRGKPFKVNGYEHDADGITTEEPDVTAAMQIKRLKKVTAMADDLAEYEQIGVYGDAGAVNAVLCWGSNKGPVIEAARGLGLKVIQPIVMSPFPVAQYAAATAGIEKIVAVENNATGQLATLLKTHGFSVDASISKYDGRAFATDELRRELSAKTKGWRG